MKSYITLALIGLAVILADISIPAMVGCVCGAFALSR